MDKNIQLMIVDDHPLFRSGLKYCLEKEGIGSNIILACNGAEAIGMLREVKVNIIFMDISMPVMDGVDATRLIKEKYPEIKVIALTIYNDRNSINKMIRAGASGYLSKNATNDEIIKACKILNEGGSYFPDEIMSILHGDKNQMNGIQKKAKLIEPLTDREMEIVKMVILGHTSKEISQSLQISKRTVEAHRTHIFDKLKIKHLIELFHYALENGLLPTKISDN